MDKKAYQEKVSSELKKSVRCDGQCFDIAENIDSITNAIKVATEQIAPPKRIKRSAPKLKIASSEIKKTGARNTQAFWDWKKAGKPHEKDNVFYMIMKR